MVFFHKTTHLSMGTLLDVNDLQQKRSCWPTESCNSGASGKKESSTVCSQTICLALCRTIQTYGYKVRHVLDKECKFRVTSIDRSIILNLNDDLNVIFSKLRELPHADLKLNEVEVSLTEIFKGMFFKMLPNCFDQIAFWTTFSTLVWNLIMSIVSLIRDRSKTNIVIQSIGMVLNFSSLMLQLCKYFVSDTKKGKESVERLVQLAIAIVQKIPEGENRNPVSIAVNEALREVFGESVINHELTEEVTDHALSMLSETAPDVLEVMEATVVAPINHSGVGIASTAIEIALSVTGIGLSIFSMVTGYDVDKMFNRAVDLQKNADYMRKKCGDLAYKVAYQYFGVAIGDQAELVKLIDKYQQSIAECLLKDPQYFSINTKRYYELKELLETIDKFRMSNQQHADQSIRPMFQSLNAEYIKLFELLRKVEQCLASSSIRPETVPFLMYGQDGTGKSWLAENLIADKINEHFGEPRGKIFKIVWGDNAHWKEPYGGEACAIQDEFLNTQAKHPLVHYLNSICSGSFFNMAGAFIKNQPCRFRAIFLVSNIVSCDLSSTLSSEAAIAFWSRMFVFHCKRAKGWEIDRNTSRHNIKYDDNFRHLTVDIHQVKRDALGGLGPCIVEGLTAQAAAQFALDICKQKDEVYKMLASSRSIDPASIEADGSFKPPQSDVIIEDNAQAEERLEQLRSPSAHQIFLNRTSGRLLRRKEFIKKYKIDPPKETNKTFVDFLFLLLAELTEAEKTDVKENLEPWFEKQMTSEFQKAWRLVSTQKGLANAILTAEMLCFKIAFVDIATDMVYITNPTMDFDPTIIYYNRNHEVNSEPSDNIFQWSEVAPKRMNESAPGQDKFVVCIWGEARQGKTEKSYRLAHDLSRLLEYPVVKYNERDKHDKSIPAIYVVSDQCTEAGYVNFYDEINAESIIINSGNFKANKQSYMKRKLFRGAIGLVNFYRNLKGEGAVDEGEVRIVTHFQPEDQSDGVLRRIGLVGKLHAMDKTGTLIQADTPHWTACEFQASGGVYYHEDPNEGLIGCDYESLKNVVWKRLVHFRGKTQKLVISKDPGLSTVNVTEWDVHIKTDNRDELYTLLSSYENIYKGYFHPKIVNGKLAKGIQISPSLVNCKTRAFSIDFFLSPTKVNTFEEWIDFAERTYTALRSDYSERTVLVEAGNEKICGIANEIKYTGLKDSRLKTKVKFDPSNQTYEVRVKYFCSDDTEVILDPVHFTANEVFNIIKFGISNLVSDPRLSKFNVTQLISIRNKLKEFSASPAVKKQERDHIQREALQEYVRRSQVSFQEKFKNFVHSSGFKFACIGISMLGGAATLAAAITAIVRAAAPPEPKEQPISISLGSISGIRFEIVPNGDGEVDVVLHSEVNIRARDITQAFVLGLKSNPNLIRENPWFLDMIDYMTDMGDLSHEEHNMFYNIYYGREMHNESQENRKKKGNNKTKGGRKVNISHRHVDGPGNNMTFIIDKSLPLGYRIVAENRNESLETCGEFSTATVQDKACLSVQNNLMGIRSFDAFGNSLTQNWALAIRDKFVVTVAHIVDEQDGVYYEAHYTKREGSNLVHKIYNLTLYNLDRENEIAVFKLPPHAESFRNIMNYIVSEDQLHSACNIMVSKPVINKFGVMFTSRCGTAAIVKHSTTDPFTSMGKVPVCKTKGKTVWATFVNVDYSKAAVPFNRPGDCGMPYFIVNASNDVSVLCGLHVAGANVYMNQSYGVAITKEYLNIVLGEPVTQSLKVFCPSAETMLNGVPTQGDLGIVWHRLYEALSKEDAPKFCFPTIGVEILRDAYLSGELETPFPFFSSPDMSFIATTNLRGKMTSKLKKYPWSDKIQNFIPNLVKPAPLSLSQVSADVKEKLPKDLNGTPSISASQLIKITDPYEVPKEIVEFLKEVGVEYVQHLKHVTDDHPYRVFSLSEAINGPMKPSDPLYGMVEPIDQDSSPGFIGKFIHKRTNKKAYFKPEAKQSCTGKIIYEFNLEDKAARDMIMLVSAVWKEATRGVRSVMIMCDALKDETLPIEKADRAGTRIISGADMVDVLFVRMVFGSMLGVQKKYRATSHCQVGIDPHSEFHFLYRRLLETGKNFIDGDFSRYDKHLLKIFLLKLFECWAAVMEPTFGNAINNLSKVVAYGLIDAVRLTEGHLWVQHRGLPSGHPLTCIVNSGVNDLMFFVALKWSYRRAMSRTQVFNKISAEAATIPYFTKHVDFVNLGDDLLIVVDNVYSDIIDFMTLKKFYRCIGIDFDTADKDGGEYKFKTGSKTKFLSRTFRSEETPVFGVIKKESISSIAHWGKKMTTEQYQNVVTDLLTEAGKMTKQEFEPIYQAILIIQEYIPEKQRIEVPSYLMLKQVAKNKLHQAAYSRPAKANNKATMAYSQPMNVELPTVCSQAGGMTYTTVKPTEAEALHTPPQESPPKLPPEKVAGALPAPIERDLVENCVASHLGIVSSMKLDRVCIALNTDESRFQEITAASSMYKNVLVKLLKYESVKTALQIPSDEEDSNFVTTSGDVVLVDNKSLQDSISFDALSEFYIKIAENFKLKAKVLEYPSGKMLIVKNLNPLPELLVFSEKTPIKLDFPKEVKEPLVHNLLNKYLQIMKAFLVQKGVNHVCLTVPTNCKLEFVPAGIRTHKVHFNETDTFIMLTGRNTYFNVEHSYLLPIVTLVKSFTLDTIWAIVRKYVQEHDDGFRVDMYTLKNNYSDRFVVISRCGVVRVDPRFELPDEKQLDWTQYADSTLPLYQEPCKDLMKYVTFDPLNDHPNSSHMSWLMTYYLEHVRGSGLDLQHAIETISQQELSDHRFGFPPFYDHLREFVDKPGTKRFLVDIMNCNIKLLSKTAEELLRYGLPPLEEILEFDLQRHAPEFHLYSVVQCCFLLKRPPDIQGTLARKYSKHWDKLMSGDLYGPHTLIIREQKWKSLFQRQKPVCDFDFSPVAGTSAESAGHVAAPTEVINTSASATVDVPLAAFDTNKMDGRPALMQGPMDTPMTMLLGGVVSTIDDAMGQYFTDGNTIEVRTNAAAGTVIWQYNLDPDRIPSVQYIKLMLHKRAKLVADAKLEILGPPNVYGSMLLGLVPFYIDKDSPPTETELIFYQNQIVALNQTAVFSFNLHRIVPEDQTSVYWDQMSDLVKSNTRRGPTAYACMWMPLQTVFNNVSAPVYLKPYCRLSPAAVFAYVDFAAVAVVAKSLRDYWTGTVTPTPEPTPTPSGVVTIFSYQGKTIAEIAKAYNITGAITICTNGNKAFNVKNTDPPVRVEGAKMNGILVVPRDLIKTRYQLRYLLTDDGGFVDSNGGFDTGYPNLIFNSVRPNDATTFEPLGEWHLYSSKSTVQLISIRGGIDTEPEPITGNWPYQWLTDGNYLWSIATYKETSKEKPFFSVDTQIVNREYNNDKKESTWLAVDPDVKKFSVDTEFSIIRYQSTKSTASGQMINVKISPTVHPYIKDSQTGGLTQVLAGNFDPTTLSNLSDSTQVIQDTTSAISLPSSGTSRMLRLEFLNSPVGTVTTSDKTQSGPTPNWTPIINQLCEDFLDQHRGSNAVEFTLQLTTNSQSIAVVRYYKNYGCCAITAVDPQDWHSVPTAVTAQTLRVVNVAAVDSTNIHPLSDLTGWTSFYVSASATSKEVSQLTSFLKGSNLTPIQKRMQQYNFSNVAGTTAEAAAAIAGLGSTWISGLFGLANTHMQTEANTRLAEMGYQFQNEQNQKWIQHDSEQRALERQLQTKWQQNQLEFGYYSANLQSTTARAVQWGVNQTNKQINKSQLDWATNQAEIQRNYSMYLSGVSADGTRQNRQLTGMTNNAIEWPSSSRSDSQNGVVIQELSDSDTESSGGSASSRDSRMGIRGSDASSSISSTTSTPRSSLMSVSSDASTRSNGLDLTPQATFSSTPTKPSSGEPSYSFTNAGDTPHGAVASSSQISQKENEASDGSNTASGVTHPTSVEPIVSHQVFDGGPTASSQPVVYDDNEIIDAKNYAVNVGNQNSSNQTSIQQVKDNAIQQTSNIVRSKAAIFNNPTSTPLSPSNSIPMSTYKPAAIPAGHGVGDYTATTSV